MTELTNERIHDLLVLPYLNHAVRMLETGYASRADIDAAMRFGCGYPAGPLTVVDELGPQAVRDALAARYAETGDRLHEPAALLQRIAAEGTTFAESASGEDVPAPELRHEIAKVGVVGTGTMASGIVQVFAQSGYAVTYVGRGDQKVAGVRASVERNLDKAIAKGRLDEPAKAEVLGRITGATTREALADVDIVVEAIAEDLEVKLELFRDLDRICRRGNGGEGAILSTTTSSLPIAELAKAVDRPEAVIGMHFFNPAVVMKLVEVVTTDLTAADVDQTVRALTARVGKVAVSCGDRSGFIVNALLFPYLNDAVKLAETGVELGVVDAAIKEQASFPMGPFELLDVVGNDVSLAIQQELYAEFDEPGFAPAETLREVVAEGRLGRKTGKGFHDYS